MAAFCLKVLQWLFFGGEPWCWPAFTFLLLVGDLNLEQELILLDPNHLSWDALLLFYHSLTQAWQTYF